MKRYITFMFLAIAGFTFLMGHAHAEAPVLLTQKVEPRVCVVDKISDFDGTTYTLNTTGCGTLIYPADDNQENGIRTPLTQQVPASRAFKVRPPARPSQPYVPTDGGTPAKTALPPVYIAGPEAAGKRDGFLIFVKKGGQYQYRLFGDNPILEPRIFQVTDIQKTTVLLTFQDAAGVFELQKGQKVSVDVAYDKSPDIVVQIEQFGYSDLEGALVRVSFPWQERMNDKSFGTVESMVAMVVFFVLASFAVMLNIHHRRKAKYIVKPKYWHDIQHSDPLVRKKRNPATSH